jgi:hypothetical protein
MLIHHLKNAFFSALKRYMTCHAIYRQKARTKSKDISGSDRPTAVCVSQRVKNSGQMGNNALNLSWTLALESCKVTCLSGLLGLASDP